MDDFQTFTSIDDFEIENGSNTECEPVCIHLLPQEEFISFDSLNYGCRLALTNFRIIIIFDVAKDKSSTSDIISIPLGLIYHLEQYGFVCLSILTKIGRRFSVRFPSLELCETMTKKIKDARASIPFSNTFYKALKSEIPTHFLLNGIENESRVDYEFDVISSEFKRLKFDKNTWTITDVNKDLELCATYPRYHIVPLAASDNMMKNMSKFRSKGRFLSVSYRYAENGTIMMRSGQPLTGVSCWRNTDDEKFFSLINDLSRQNDNNTKESFIQVFDARSYTFAQLNRVKGGGMESQDYYQSSKVEFLSIPNMHFVRNSFEALSKSLLEVDDDNFYDLVAKSGWLQLLKQLLKSATLICDTMLIQKKSVLIHCSDGWDRTPQLASLAQIMMDPFYRTIDGFKTLIYREWILYGHKFAERCALWPYDFSKEYSPIFLQWLDCIYQLLQQFPDHFHFNETFLIKLAIHVHSGLFGTFNETVSKSHQTCNIWSYLCQKDTSCFINPLYSPFKSFKMMRPKLQLINIKLWSKLYFDSLNPNYHEKQHPEKYSGELPREINNITMLNSVLVEKEEMDDYEGENVEFQPSLLAEILNEITDEFRLTKSHRKDSHKENNYFTAYSLKCSLETMERQPDSDAKLHLELDVDGLFKQTDFIEQYSDFNRHRRHFYKNKIEYYRTELIKYRRMIDTDNICLENPVEDEEMEAEALDNDDMQSWDEQYFSVGKVVLWVPDHSVNNCSDCNTQFGFLCRRHHCRGCGLIFCSNCSQHKTTLPKQNLNWNVRVCNKCFEELGSTEETKSGIYSLFSNLRNTLLNH